MNLRISLVCLAGLWSALVSPLLADTNATLAGRISDPNGAMIPKAKIAVTNDDTGLKRTTESNAEGLYVLADLPPGTYKVEVEAQGFETLEHDGVILRVQDIVTQNYSMKLGAVTNSVRVEAGASMVQADSGAVGAVIDRRFVENMPLNGRSFQSLIFLAPGVVLTPASGNSQGQFSVNGQRANSNYFTIDGVSANFAAPGSASLGAGLNGSLPAFNGAGATNGLVSVDALQEFQIQTSSYSVEYGRSPGAQISIVTRSGTNQFHGSLFEYFRNDVVDANDWFANANRAGHAALRQSDFGGVFGGPVVLPGFNGRDRTFFFLSYEGLQLRQPQTAVVPVPSLALRASVSGAAQQLLNAFPLPTGPASGSFAPFAGSFSNPTSMHAGGIRVDQTLPGNTLVFARYDESPQSFSQRGTGTLSPSQVTFNDNLTRTLTIAATSTFTPRLTNDLRVNYSSSSIDSTTTLDSFQGAVPPPQSLLFPAGANLADARSSVTLLLGGSLGFFSLGQGQNNVARQFNVVEMASLAVRNHLLIAGLDFRRIATVFRPAADVYSANFFSLSGLQTQTASSGSVQTATEVRPRVINFSAFIGDTWRATKRLSLTYGVRWEFNPAPTEASGLLPLQLADINNFRTSGVAPAGTPIYRTRYSNFAPRAGFAYQLRRDPSRQTVIRGGAGVFYDLGSSSALYGLGAYPYTLTKPIPSAPFPFSAANFAPAVAVTAPPYPGNSFTVDPNANLPYTIHFNVAIEQAIGRSQTVTATYTGALGRRLPFFANFLATSGVKNPNFTNGLGIIRNIATSDYHALELAFHRRLARGLQTYTSYTWSHAIDEQSDEVTQNLRRGDAIFDRRQAFKAAISYDIPGAHRDAIVSALTSHWSVDSMIYAVSAPPINFNLVSLIAPDGTPITQSPNLVANVPLYIPDPNAPGGTKLNFAAFANASSGQLGTLGRDALRGLPMTQMDLSLRREFRIRERLHLQARADSFNLLNHPNFGPYNVLVGLTNPLFGVATTMFGAGLGGGGGNGGFNPLYQIGGPRSNQISLKLIF